MMPRVLARGRGLELAGSEVSRLKGNSGIKVVSSCSVLQISPGREWWEGWPEQPGGRGNRCHLNSKVHHKTVYNVVTACDK